MNSASHDSTLRVGYVPGVEPDRFAQRWKGVHRGARLELIPIPYSRQYAALAAGEMHMCFARMHDDVCAPPKPEPGPSAATGPDASWLHVVKLWEEQPVIVMSRDHVLSVADELEPDDLVDETEIPAQHADDARDRVEVVATGVGYTRLPLSLARLHARKSITHRPLLDAEPTQIALMWPRENDDDLRQQFVGVVRGRTARSSRS